MWVHLTFNQMVAGSIHAPPSDKSNTYVVAPFSPLCGQTYRLVPFVPKDIQLRDCVVHAPHDVLFLVKEWQIHDLERKHVSIE